MRKAGETAPAFQLPDNSGRETALEAELAQGPVLLAFFKVTCPVCQFTFPYLDRLARESGVRVFGISQDPASATNEFNRKFGVTFPTMLDSGESGYRVSNAYAIDTVPSLFLVEPDRRISLAGAGFSRATLDQIGNRFGSSPFREGERVPDFKPG